MTYPYAVKHNGKWYRPNENVPDETISKTETIEESAIQPVISQVKEVQPVTTVEDEPRQRGRRRKDY